MSRNMSNPNSLLNFTEYFREEHDVWVMCLIPGQVAINFEVSPGHQTVFSVPNTGDPYNLTQRFPWDAIKRSTDLRHFVSGRAEPALRLMTPTEVEAHFAKKAERLGLANAAAAKQVAERRRQEMYSRQGPTQRDRVDPVTPLEDEIEEKPVRQDQLIQPRIIHLCRQVASDIPDNDRMPAAQFLDELESIEGSLSIDDMQYLVGNGRYRSIIRWADVRMKAMFSGEESSAESAIIEDDIPETRIGVR